MQKRKGIDSGSTQVATTGAATAFLLAKVTYTTPYFLKFVQISSTRATGLMLRRYYTKDKAMKMSIKRAQEGYTSATGGYFAQYWHFPNGLYCWGFDVYVLNSVAGDTLTTSWEAVEA